MSDAFATLEATIAGRLAADPGTSYIASLAGKGRAKIAQKVGEEAVETVIAAIADDRAALVGEATDLIFHLTVLLHHAGLTLDDVRAELARREGVSGLVEKAGRPSKED
ncbi:phosphoribosyl-ATP diphosphatase [Sphingomonas sp.]|uniref:phosphoribosyl-ATP diphosphatase n=1 Tax=Sphingomonas sp. TaxID=28214 RepID=UPI002DD6653F|nr:phosphoribosyl-ATP diphosphatase [Sphingomonas sp.]